MAELERDRYWRKYAEERRLEQRKIISDFGEYLVKEKVLEDFGIHDRPSKPVVKFGGVIDLADLCKPEECLSRPSIAWDCEIAECSLEADLPVPPKKQEDLVKYVNAIPRCCVSEVHAWPEAKEVAPAERHVHVVCKGIYPKHIAGRVNQLILETMKRRGHPI